MPFATGRYGIADPGGCVQYLERSFVAGIDEIMPIFQVGPITHQELVNTLRIFGKHKIPRPEEVKRKAKAGAAADR